MTNNHEHPISLDHATTPGLDPVALIGLAGDLACDAVSIRMSAFPGFDEQAWSIVSEAPLRRRIRTELDARGMFFAVGAGFEINNGVPVDTLQPALDALADAGGRGLSVVVYDEDRGSHVDRLGELAERSGKLGLRTLVEFFALSGVNSLGYTLDLIQEIDSPALGISADSLHIARTGATADQLAAVSPGLISHAQLNDGPAFLAPEDQWNEASGERLLPGDGEFDLLGFVRALPAGVPIGVEAGSRSAFAAGVTMQEHGRLAIDATRRVVASALSS